LNSEHLFQGDKFNMQPSCINEMLKAHRCITLCMKKRYTLLVSDVNRRIYNMYRLSEKYLTTMVIRVEKWA